MVLRWSQANWIGDGLWYDAEITEVLDHGYKVKFTKYGNEAEVPYEYLRPKGDRPPPAGHKRAAAESEEGKGEAGFVIPLHLRILPTDSEEERARKRKRVKHLKQAAKKKDYEEEETEKSKSWQQFLNKVRHSSCSIGLAVRSTGSCLPREQVLG